MNTISQGLLLIFWVYGAIRVQTGWLSMETMDTMDNFPFDCA